MRKIETEDGATDKNGAKVELYADPATGGDRKARGDAIVSPGTGQLRSVHARNVF